MIAIALLGSASLLLALLLVARMPAAVSVGRTAMPREIFHA